VKRVNAPKPRVRVIGASLWLAQQPRAFIQAHALATQRLLQQLSRLPELRDGLVHLNQLFRSVRLPAFRCPSPCGKAVQEGAGSRLG
jgi:hypothetical protein